MLDISRDEHRPANQRHSLATCLWWSRLEIGSNLKEGEVFLGAAVPLRYAFTRMIAFFLRVRLFPVGGFSVGHAQTYEKLETFDELTVTCKGVCSQGCLRYVGPRLAIRAQAFDNHHELQKRFCLFARNDLRACPADNTPTGNDHLRWKFSAALRSVLACF